MNQIVFLFVLIPVCSLGQTPVETQLFNPEQLKQDLNFLFERLEAIHPSLYHYTSQQRVLEARSAVEKELNRPMSRVEFARQVIPLVSMLKDAHTSLNFPQEERATFLKNGGRVFPFDLLFRENRFYITTNYSADSSILKSTEILSINGLASGEILDALRPYISAELDFYRDVRIQRAFRRLLWYTYGWEDFDLQLSYDGTVTNKKIAGVTDQQFQSALKKNAQVSVAPLYSYYRLNEKTGVIDFRSMNDLKKFSDFLDSTFAIIKKDHLEHLVIDVRNNGGGNSQLGEALINYISDKPYRLADRMEVKNSAYAGESRKKGTISVFNNDDLKKPKSPRDKFHGKTYLLTSHVTFSSANMLAAAFKCYTMGTVVGEETGGVLIVFGDLIDIKLPNTQLQGVCSHKKFVHPCSDDSLHGIRPDVEITPTLEDIRMGRDPVMEYLQKVTTGGN